MKKRLLNLILVVVLILAILPAITILPVVTQKWTAMATSNMKQPIVGGYPDNLNYATTSAEYNCLMGGMPWDINGIKYVNQVIPTNGKISSLFVELSTAQIVASASYTFTLMIGDTPTAMTCVIGAGQSVGTYTATEISVTAGDLVCIRSVATATDPTAATARWSTLFESDTDGETIIMSKGKVEKAYVFYTPLQASSFYYTTTEARAVAPMPTAGTFKKFYVAMAFAPEAQSYTFALRVGGSNKNNMVTISGWNQTGNITNVTDAVVAGDSVNWIGSPSATPPSSDSEIAFSIVFVPTTYGESLLLNAFADTPSTVNTEYAPFISVSGAFTTTERYSLIQSCTVRSLYVKLSAAPGSGNTYTISVNKDGGAASGLTVNISGSSATTGNDLTHTYEAGAGDTISTKSVPYSGPTAAYVSVGLVLYIAPGVTSVYLTTSSGVGGNVSTPGEGTYAYNVSEIVSIVATADYHFSFVNWTGDTANISNVNAASTTINMSSSNQSAVANFTAFTLSISNTPDSKVFGFMLESTSYWSNGSAPTFALNDSQCFFAVTNNGDIASITINATNFTGGVGWALNASVDVDKVVMKAGKSGDANEAAMIVLNSSPQAFISGLAASATKKWEIKLETGTFTDGVTKNGSIILTGVLD